jgi:hypothetical protein
MSEQAAPLSSVDLRPISPPFWATKLKPAFLFALLLSTWVPMIFFVWNARLESVLYGFGAMKSMLLFLGTAHVPATIFFYVDKDFAEIIKTNKLRYVYLPIVLTVATGFVFAFGGTAVQAYVLLIYWSWQAFHYGRQNTGIYSFLSIAKRGTKPDRSEKIIIDLATWCGIIGTFKILGLGVAPAYMREPVEGLYRFGTWAFAAVLLASIAVYIKNVKRTTPLLTVFYFTLVCFFLPIFISTDITVAFFSYAMAHGLQYLVFMTVVSLNFSPQSVSNRIHVANAVKLFGFIIVVGFIFYRSNDLKTIEFFTSHGTPLRAVDFVIGAILGATMAHFVIDAGAWRLSKPQQRMYIGNRFDFIFARNVSPERTRSLDFGAPYVASDK